MTNQIRALINRVNAQKSTGPKTTAGKQRSRMNAVTHNLSGQNLILQETELAAYNRMAAAMLVDLNPKTEPERQIAQKVIDINFRLNRLAAIENNIFSFGLTENETDAGHDDRIEVMAAQTRAWIERSNSFDCLGRYEARLSRQLLKYQEEFERLQAARKNLSNRQIEEIEEDKFNPASFGQAADSWRVLTYLPPPKPTHPQEPCTAGDLVTGVLPQIPEIHMEA
jgi:hypothetical protein